MLRNLGVTVRRLLARPTFTLTAVATLAIGVGATTAIFSTVNATLLEPLPYPDSNDLYELRTTLVDGRWSSGRVTAAYAAAINEGAPSVVRAVLTGDREDVVITEEGDNRDVLTQSVGEGFFELFDLPMVAGRAFRPEDHVYENPEDLGRVVISHELWTEVFGQDPDIVESTMEMARGRVQVLGVAPPELDVPEDTDVWLAFSLPPTSVAHSFEAWLRVRPGTDPERLRSELASVMSGLAQEYPQAASGRAFVATRLVDAIVGDLGPILLVVLAGAGALLLLAAVNVAMLILGRGAGQTKEMAIRASMGASRGSVFRHFLAESFVLAAAGTVVGLAVAWVGVRLLLRFGASQLPRLEEIPFDPRVLLFAVAVLAVTTVVVGFLPALRLATPDIRGLLNENSRSTTGSRGTHRLLSGLVIVEVALAITLVAGGGWLVRSYQNLTATDPGFTPERRLVFEAFLYGSYYAPRSIVITGPDGDPMLAPDQPEGSTPAEWLRQVSTRLQSNPQIGAVGSATTMPLSTDWDAAFYVSVPGEPYDPDQQDTGFRRLASPEFFEAMGVQLVAGRTFTYDDDQAVAVVNRAFVDRYLPDRDPVGAVFAWGFPLVNFDSELTIIGVVDDIRYSSLTEPADPVFYQPGFEIRQAVAIETTLDDPASLIPFVRAEAAAVEPSVPIEIEPLEAMVDREMVRHRLGLVLMSLFAVVSLALAAVGIYGVIAHITAQRRAELATRIALGATPRRVRGLVMGQGRALAALGVGIGITAAYLGGRIATSRLYEVEASDWMVLAGAGLAVLAVTLGAFWIPAVRAAKIEPMKGLLGD